MSKKVLIAGENEELCDFLSSYAEKEGFVNGFTQEFASADESFIPEFSLKKESSI